MIGSERKPQIGHIAMMKPRQLSAAQTAAIGIAFGQYSSHSPGNFLMYLTHTMRYAAMHSHSANPVTPMLK